MATYPSGWLIGQFYEAMKDEGFFSERNMRKFGFGTAKHIEQRRADLAKCESERNPAPLKNRTGQRQQPKRKNRR